MCLRRCSWTLKKPRDHSDPWSVAWPSDTNRPFEVSVNNKVVINRMNGVWEVKNEEHAIFPWVVDQFVRWLLGRTFRSSTVSNDWCRHVFRESNKTADTHANWLMDNSERNGWLLIFTINTKMSYRSQFWVVTFISCASPNGSRSLRVRLNPSHGHHHACMNWVFSLISLTFPSSSLSSSHSSLSSSSSFYPSAAPSLSFKSPVHSRQGDGVYWRVLLQHRLWAQGLVLHRDVRRVQSGVHNRATVHQPTVPRGRGLPIGEMLFNAPREQVNHSQREGMSDQVVVVNVR